MPTNKERSDTAARLRNYASLRESFKESPICGFINALGFGGYLDWKDVCNRIADLIEPEERTCRMEYDKIKRGVYCSQCGERMDVYTWEHHVDGTAGYLYPFCYWCGSKVVEE